MIVELDSTLDQRFRFTKQIELQIFKMINLRTYPKRDEEIKDGHMELDEAELILNGGA